MTSCYTAYCRTQSSMQFPTVSERLFRKRDAFSARQATSIRLIDRFKPRAEARAVGDLDV